MQHGSGGDAGMHLNLSIYQAWCLGHPGVPHRRQPHRRRSSPHAKPLASRESTARASTAAPSSRTRGISTAPSRRWSASWLRRSCSGRRRWCRYLRPPSPHSCAARCPRAPPRGRRRPAQLERYYSFDDNFMLEVVGKQLTKGLRKDLDEVAAKLRLPLRSCQRQFDNLRRVVSKTDGKSGRLVVRASRPLPCVRRGRRWARGGART